MSTADPLLVAEDLHRSYRRKTGAGRRRAEVDAVRDVSLQLDRGESLGIVGGSGSGKSTLARLLLALERPCDGVVRFEGRPISALPESQVRPLRRYFQAVFQDPSSSLDPCLKIDTIVAEPLVAHSIGTGSERRRRVTELLSQVGLPRDAERKHPREFSGGERQRIAIARALATGPRLLILDEPTSSLDTSVQAQIIDLMAELRRQHELALIWVSHDLAVVRDVCEKVAVMHEGAFVEEGPTTEVLKKPQHPYTRDLLDAAPRFEHR